MGQGSKFNSALSTTGGRANLVTSEDIASGDSFAKDILKEMEEEGIKFSKEKILFAVKLENRKIIYLEIGDSQSGMIHILERHGDDFAKAFADQNVTKDNLQQFLCDTISKGKLVSSYRRDVNGKEGYCNVYYYKGHHTVVFSIASNGFIIESRPGKWR